MKRIVSLGFGLAPVLCCVVILPHSNWIGLIPYTNTIFQKVFRSHCAMVAWTVSLAYTLRRRSAHKRCLSSVPLHNEGQYFPTILRQCQTIHRRGHETSALEWCSSAATDCVLFQETSYFEDFLGYQYKDWRHHRYGVAMNWYYLIWQLFLIRLKTFSTVRRLYTNFARLLSSW